MKAISKQRRRTSIHSATSPAIKKVGESGAAVTSGSLNSGSGGRGESTSTRLCTLPKNIKYVAWTSCLE